MNSQVLSQEKLNQLPKEVLVTMFLQQSENFRLLTEQSVVIQKQNEALLKQVEDLNERVAILTNRLFGKKSEKCTETPGQYVINLDDPMRPVINEAEAVIEVEGYAEEPGIEEVVVRKRTPRPKGKRDIDLKAIETMEVTHYLSEEELKTAFPEGWKRLPDEIYRELERIPESYRVMEHHVGVYAGRGTGDGVIRGKAPERLLSHSILTPSLAASVFTAKYINAVPLNRLSEWYACSNVHISRQVMAGWMIKLHEYYLEPVHAAMKKELFRARILHCDETPFKMTGRRRKQTRKARIICVM